jgi:hypothetical protein
MKHPFALPIVMLLGIVIPGLTTSVSAGDSASPSSSACGKEPIGYRLSVFRGPDQWLARLSLDVIPDDLRLTLNDRSITTLFDLHRIGTQVVALAPDDGLRQGMNRLVSEAVHRGCVYPARSKVFRVPWLRPLASGGSDHEVRTFETVYLDAGGTLSGRLGQSRTVPIMSRSWRLLEAPEGSRARLSSTAYLSPSMTPDVNGTYRIQLTVRDARGAKSVDVVTISAYPNYPKIGLAVETMALQPDGGYAIEIGSNCGPEVAGCAPQVFPYGDDPVQLLILDRTTLEVVFHQTYAGTSSDAEAIDSQILSQPSDGSTLVILAATPQAQAVLSPVLLDLWDLLINPPNGDPVGSSFNPEQGGWSLLGIPLLGSNPTTQPAGFLSTGAVDDPSPGVPGNLTGYLQNTSFSIDGNTSTTFSGYNFLGGAYADYNTSVASTISPLSNTMSINGSDYHSQIAPTECIGSFHLVMLRADTLGPLDNVEPSQTFFTNCGDKGTGPELQQLGWLTDTIATGIQVGAKYGGALVFLQGLGTPLYQDPDPEYDGIRKEASEQLSALIESLGGIADVFNKSMYSGTGNTNYALAGSSALLQDMPTSTPIPPYAPEASGAATGMSAAKPVFLDGTLQRNRYGHYAPANGAAALTMAGLVPTIAYQPTTAWPTGQTPGEQAALVYLNDQVLQLEPPQTAAARCYDPVFHDVRYLYCDENVKFGNTGTGWQDLSNALVPDLGTPACKVPYPSDPTVKFSEDDWQAVCIDIGVEAAWVHRVHTGISQLVEYYLEGAGDSSSLEHVVSTVLEDLEMADSSASTAGFWVSLAGDAVNILAAGLSGGGSLTVEAAATGILGNTGALVGEALSGVSGSSYLGPVEAIAGDLPTEVYNRYFAAGGILGGLANIIVGDYGKLKALGDTYYDQVLSFDSTTLTKVVQHLSDAGTLFAYGRLLGSAYQAYGLLPDDENPSYPASPSAYECTDEFNYHPFGDYGTDQNNAGPSWIGLTVPNISTPLPIYGGNPNLLVIADVQLRTKWDWLYPELAADDPPVEAMQDLFSKTTAWAPTFFRQNFRVHGFDCEGIHP